MKFNLNRSASLLNCMWRSPGDSVMSISELVQWTTLASILAGRNTMIRPVAYLDLELFGTHFHADLKSV